MISSVHRNRRFLYGTDAQLTNEGVSATNFSLERCDRTEWSTARRSCLRSRKGSRCSCCFFSLSIPHGNHGLRKDFYHEQYFKIRADPNIHVIYCGGLCNFASYGCIAYDGPENLHQMLFVTKSHQKSKITIKQSVKKFDWINLMPKTNTTGILKSFWCLCRGRNLILHEPRFPLLP